MKNLTSTAGMPHRSALHLTASRRLVLLTALACAATATFAVAQNAGTFTCAAGPHALTANTRFTGTAGNTFGWDLQASPTSYAHGACSSAQPFLFSIAEGDGNYQVTVVLGGPDASTMTIKAEARRLMVLQAPIPAGGRKTFIFNVNVRTPQILHGGKVKLKEREIGALDWDDKLTLEFNGDRPSVRSITIKPVDVPTVYLAGDSTVVDQDKEPWAAWGQMLPLFFDRHIAIANHAESGETIKGFLGEHRFDKIFSTFKQGDFLFLQFAHNDQKPGSGFSSIDEYKQEVRALEAQVKAKGGTLILVSSMNRRAFDEDGKIRQTLGGYPQAMRDVAAEDHVALIDLNAMSKTLYEAMGPQGTLKAFVHYRTPSTASTCPPAPSTPPSSPMETRSLAIRRLLARTLSCMASTALLAIATIPGTAQTPARLTQSFNDHWRFIAHDTPGAERPSFDDTSWQRLSVPHDWAIAGPLAQSNPSGQGGGYFPSGIGWYRKDFPLASAQSHKHIYIVFDGVMANSDVWINGVHLGHRPNGTVSFYYDLTGHLNFGPRSHNLLAVRSDTSQQPASRWYEGNGIYRKVRLVLLNDIHIAPWGTVVTTPNVSADSATIQVESLVDNDSDKPANVSLTAQLQPPSSKPPLAEAALTARPVLIAPHTSATLHLVLTVPHPDRWDIDHPAMYTLHAFIHAGKSPPSDDEAVAFGIREFHFDADTGFWLNDRNFKLKGAALHIDGGAVGIAVPAAIYERRLLALRALGVNAIRTAHNPPSPDFLDLCDRLGFLVMDEMFDCWTVGKNPYDYHLYFRDWALRDLHDTVLRDRNHPSIILWSAGNEIHDTPHPDIAIPILKSLVAAFHAADPTRPVTQGLFRPNASHDYDDGLADLLDVVGQNYREQEILAAHAQKPTRKILGTENTHDRNQWIAMRDHAPYSGQFLWTGVDYLGEAGEHGGWPLFANSSGLLDRTLVPRARAFERQSWWAAPPNIHAVRRLGPSDKVATDPGYENLPKSRQVLFPDWSPADRTPHTEAVEVYTNAEEADLLLNGRSLGRQKLHPDATPLTWSVPFEPGTLTSIGYTAGKEVARDELHTAGPAAAILLVPDSPTFSADPDGVLTVRAEIVDAHGTLVPDASNLLTFAAAGARIQAVDSGSNTDHDPFQADARHAFQGRAIVIVQASQAGDVALTATAAGLQPTTIHTRAAASKDSTSPPRSF